MARQSLGRGLSALLGDTIPATENSPSEIDIDPIPAEDPNLLTPYGPDGARSSN